MIGRLVQTFLRFIDTRLLDQRLDLCRQAIRYWPNFSALAASKKRFQMAGMADDLTSAEGDG
jgi:hypothetical protein